MENNISALCVKICSKNCSISIRVIMILMEGSMCDAPTA